ITFIARSTGFYISKVINIMLIKSCVHFYQKEGKVICCNCKVMRMISSLMYD
ncbi:hypothetical protein TNCT_26161, partial [Trichonephila clavata]